MPQKLNKPSLIFSNPDKKGKTTRFTSQKEPVHPIGQVCLAKISKNYKLAEDVVDFLDRAHYYLGFDRTAIIEELVRNKAQELNLPPMPKHKPDQRKKMKEVLKIK